MKRAVPVLFCLVLFAAHLLAPAPATASSTDVASIGECQGPVSMWRSNELTEGGSMAGFLEATRDHQAWLDGKGHNVRIRTWTAFKPVPEEERPGPLVAFGSEIVYPTLDTFGEVMAARDADRDEAYEAFTQKYRDNTTIKEQRLVCLSE